MNFVQGAIESGLLRAGKTRLPLPAGLAGGATTGKVTVGLRPESFLLPSELNADEAGLGAQISGRIEIVEDLGPESCVYFRTDDLDVVDIGERPQELQGALCARLRAGVPFQVGDLIELAIRRENVRLFEDQTGKAISGAPVAVAI